MTLGRLLAWALPLGIAGATAAVAGPTDGPGSSVEGRYDLPAHYLSFLEDGPRGGSDLVRLGARQDANAPYDGGFHFMRIQYSSGRSGGGFGGGFGRRRGGGGAMWAHDYPRADYNFLAILEETTNVFTSRRSSNVVGLSDPELFNYPVAYIVEPGAWRPSETDVEKLGEYLRKGGFLIVDDFRGYRDLDNLQFILSQVLPELNMVAVEDADEIFDSFFRIVPRDVIPPYGNEPAAWYGIYEDNDRSKRLMVIINANNDIAEYWEFSDQAWYSIDLSNEAYKLGVNYVIYGLTH